MPKTIKNINGRYLVEYDRGIFDEWCVYVSGAGPNRYAPKDPEYFGFLQQLARSYGVKKVYADFVLLYRNTGNRVDANTLALIEQISTSYSGHTDEVQLWLTVIYAGMIAEENKAHTRLGKRVKRLGIHQVLIENMAPEIAASFSRGRPWRDLNEIMNEKGI